MLSAKLQSVSLSKPQRHHTVNVSHNKMRNPVLPLLIILIYGCKNPNNIASSTDDISLIEYRTDTFTYESNKCVVEIYKPQFKDSLSIFNETIDSFFLDHKSIITHLEQHFDETYPDDYEYEKQESIVIQEFERVFQNDSIISFVVPTYYYWSGAAHGQNSSIVINLNFKTGMILQADDVFQQTMDAQNYIVELINSKAKKIDEGCWGFKETKDFKVFQDNFVIKEDSVTFYFSDYTICPYVFGNPSVTIEQEKLKSILRK